MRRAHGIALLALAVLGITQVLPVCAQGYPNRAIRMIVGFPPGGFTDILARQIGDRLAPGMGQTIVIDNRSGNAGIIGADIVAKSKPDGYTLLTGHNNSNAVAPSLYAKMPYDVRKDFTPIALTGHVATVLVVHPSVPAKSVQEFIAVARESKGQLRVASSDVGSTQHLAIERWSSALRSLMGQPEFADRILTLGGQLAKPDTPEEFVKFIDLEIERWGRIVRAAKVRLD